MFEIKGKVNTAICYAKVCEDEAIEQIKRMCDYEITKDSRIRIMPDVHAGAGCTIGTTMTIKDKVVPNVVGVDIGCGMYVVRLGKQDIDFKQLDEIVHKIPSGMNVWNKPQEEFNLGLLACYNSLNNVHRLECSLGTLGGGNHFIEVDEAIDGTKYLVIHTGSRNLGLQVANHYQDLAIKANFEDYMYLRDDAIERLKAAGRAQEIEDTLKQLFNEKVLPKDLCYVYGDMLEDYLHDIDICQTFACRNREFIANYIINQMGWTIDHCRFHTIHNYIDIDNMILRKGAIAARKNEVVLIPINMRDGAILAKGKGNAEWNYSAPHGAGRIMSRAAAKNSLTMEEYRKEMANVYTTSVNEATLDEAPMAYKSLNDIIDVIGDTVEVIEVLKPVYNFKAN